MSELLVDRLKKERDEWMTKAILHGNAALELEEDLRKAISERDALRARVTELEAASSRKTFRSQFMALAIDGRIRSVKHVREDLGLDEGANVGESLRTLQSILASEQSEWKLRNHSLTGRAHVAVWWLEKRK